MASDPKPSLLTPEQFLERERKAEGKSEYWQGQAFAMAGAGRFHSRTSRNVIAALTIGLRHASCQTYGSDMRLHVPATGLYTYPDVMVTCGEELYIDAVLDTLLNPALIIEVLSKSTRN